MRIAACFLLLLLLPACGKLEKKFGRHSGPGTTTVRIGSGEKGFARITSTMTGGVMVYVVNESDPERRASAYVPNEDYDIEWTLPNARYKFLAFGYESSGMTGNIRCAYGGIHDLIGTPRDIVLTLTRANCQGADFQPAASIDSTSGADKQPSALLFVGCGSSSGFNMLTATAPWNVCDNSGGRPPASSLFNSIQLSFPEFDALDGDLDIMEGGPADEIESTCQNRAAAHGAHETTGFRVLPGGPNSPFLMAIDIYDTVGCTGAGDRALFGFEHGLANFGNGDIIFATTPGGSSTETEVSPPEDPMIKVIHDSAGNWNRIFFREFGI